MQIFKQIKLYALLLNLIALHSLLVGIGLIVLPFNVLSMLGFTVDPYRFFSTQGGVFHLVMAVAYYLAARDPISESNLVIFIIIAKWIAFFFLSLFFIFGEHIAVVALSAVSDGLMGLLVLMFFLEHNTQEARADE